MISKICTHDKYYFDTNTHGGEGFTLKPSHACLIFLYVYAWKMMKFYETSRRKFEALRVGVRHWLSLFLRENSTRVIEPRRTKQPWDFRHRGKTRPLNTWRNRTNRIRKSGIEKCRRAAWVHCSCTYTCTHRYVLERYLWHERHADGNECPGFSDVPRIIVHPLRSSANNFAFLRVPLKKKKKRKRNYRFYSIIHGLQSWSSTKFGERFFMT